MLFNWLNKSSKLVKVTFPCQFLNGSLGTETMFCAKVKEGYKVKNVPFYALNIAFGDIIEIKKIDKELWFENLIRASGNSVVQLKILQNHSQTEIGKIFEQLGCDWEGSDRKDLISIDVPADLDYKIVESELIAGFEDGKWDYREACLGFKCPL
jgi:hypothetical protein